MKKHRLNPLWSALLALLLCLGTLLDAQATESITDLHTDLSGSPVAATNAGGAVLWRESYRLYGERTQQQAASCSNRPFFHGKPYDADTGLSYFGARYYDPLVGRFMSVDPAGFDEGNLHSFNRYAYGNNNPYRYLDPDGRSAIRVLVGLAVWVGVEMLPQPALPPGSRQVNAVAFPDMTAVAAKVGIGVLSAIERTLARSVVSTVEKSAAQEAAKGATETVRVGELVATHGRMMSNKQLDKLTKNIRAEGIKQPLTVTEHNGKLYILDGHHRALAAPRAGVAEVPINRVELPFGAFKSPADLTFTPGVRW